MLRPGHLEDDAVVNEPSGWRRLLTDGASTKRFRACTLATRPRDEAPL
jgi:hypothetical protein